MMILTSMQYLDMQKQDTSAVTYSYGSEYVQFNGMKAYVGFGDHVYPVSWSVMKINAASGSYSPYSTGSAVTMENFTHYSSRRIMNEYQDSAVLTMSNGQVSVAEIFSFLPNGIDASYAVENTGHGSASFLVTFALRAHYHSTASVNGFYPQGIDTSQGAGNVAVPINRNDWNITTGNVSVNWKSESGIFSTGIVAQSEYGNSNVMDLVFGSLNIAVNETYSIDPVISPSPDRIIGGGSPSRYVYLSDFAVTYPSGESVVFSNPTQIVFPAYSTISFSVKYNAAGSPHDPWIQFNEQIPGGYRPISRTYVSGTGTLTFQWKVLPGYYTGFFVSGSGGALLSYSRETFSFTESPYVNGGVFYNFADADSHGVVYDSSGTWEATLGGVAINEYNGVMSTGPEYKYQFSVGLWNGSRGLGANYVNQTFAWKGDSSGNNPSNDPGAATMYPLSYYSQGAGGGGMTTAAEEAVYATVAAALLLTATPVGIGVGLVMTFLAPFIFQDTHDYPTSNHHGYKLTFTAVQPGNDYVILNPNGTTSSIFKFSENVEINSVSALPVMEFFQYTSQVVLWNTSSNYYYPDSYYAPTYYIYDGPVYTTSFSEPLFYTVEG